MGTPNNIQDYACGPNMRIEFHVNHGTDAISVYINACDTYSYQTVRPNLFWGYSMMNMQDGKVYPMATPGKALLDLLYLYPQYQTEAQMLDLRLDEDWLDNELNHNRLQEYMASINSPALTKRLNLLKKAYGI